MFNFTKEPRSNNLFQVREAQIVTVCNITGLVLTYYLAYRFFANGPFPNGEVIVISLVQFIAALIKISTLYNNYRAKNIPAVLSETILAKRVVTVLLHRTVSQHACLSQLPLRHRTPQRQLNLHTDHHDPAVLLSAELLPDTQEQRHHSFLGL